MENCLIIFLRYPEAGEVKTRLARKIGHEKAAKLYRLFVEATIMRTFDKEGYYEQLLFYTPAKKRKEIESWMERLFATTSCRHGMAANLPLARLRDFVPRNDINDALFYPQIGSDLGERMFNALKTAHSSGAKKAVIIGTDSPTVDREIICKAFCLLKENNVVIGPTVDGGYYLIGVSSPAGWHGQTDTQCHSERSEESRSCLSVLFTGINWGSNKVFEQTVKRVKEINVSYSILPLHYDVDNLEDLKTLKQEILLMDVNKRCGLLDIYKTIENDLNI